MKNLLLMLCCLIVNNILAQKTLNENDTVFVQRMKNNDTIWVPTLIENLAWPTKPKVLNYNVPEKVEKTMYKNANYRSRPIDTVVCHNYRYVFHVSADSIMTKRGKLVCTKWDLIHKDKLYTDYWAGVGLGYFFTSWAGLIMLPKYVETDKILHAAMGGVIGAGTNGLVYHYTKKKWLAFGAGCAAAGVAGVAKEYIYDANREGGVPSKKDAMATFLGGVFGSFGVRIILK